MLATAFWLMWAVFSMLESLILVVGLIAGWYARSREVAMYQEIVHGQATELKEWQTKALFKHGHTPLGAEKREPKEPDPNKQPSVRPSVVTRQEMEYRRINTNPVNSHITKVRPPNVENIITEAQAVIDAT